MGCDIHPIVEYLVPGQTEWYSLCTPDIGRNYLVFGLMAGVRRVPSFGPVAAPKGLEYETLSWQGKQIIDDGGHTASWLSAEELMTVVRKFPEAAAEFGYEHTTPPAWITFVVAGMRALESANPGYKTRLAFNFDN